MDSLRAPALTLFLFTASFLGCVETIAQPSGTQGVAVHLDSIAHINRAIRQVERLVDAHPGTPVRLILIASAVEPALEGAMDKNGGLYSAQLEQLLARGVGIFACETTLISLSKRPDELTFGVDTVPSGIAELARLQLESDYAYLKL